MAVKPNAANRQQESVALSPDRAHPKAKALLSEAFFWSATEKSAPFGNEEGAAAFSGFRQWRPANPNDSPVLYLNQLIANWNYPAFDLTTVTLDELSAYITQGPSGAGPLIEQDNAVIAVGFGQFVLEGRIEKDLQILTKIALQRELLPVLLSHFPDSYQPKRRDLLSRLLKAVEAM
ncbi:hypothetical protein GCM10023189_46960 [Nibrella saemangeumensis]|uniref:Uncharacterized protein n=1 Tax=Nibrella saemangeumensis TaxID=1084526 RepID=A0ABP8NH87_9BACT